MTPSHAATTLLAHIGKPPPAGITPLAGGRNNHVWRVDCGNETFLLKKYFWSDSDPRDRLGQEWAFLEFLQSIGSAKAPSPLARDSTSRFALMEFIPGTPPMEITESDILDAARFLTEINAAREFAKNLPPVSEACFSIQEHLDSVASRVTRLERITAASKCHLEAIHFTQSTLLPLWDEIRRHIGKDCSDSLTTILAPEKRCLSPSDFGFHNALRQPNGSLRYVDFEYAGWDDPAKTLIDFTNQPDRLLPENLATLFLENTIPLFAGTGELRKRLSLLTPLYQLKWSCICLNAFLPDRPLDPTRPLTDQLARAQTTALRAEKNL